MRKNLGISQKELARASGVSQSYIARLEKGDINPTYERVRKIYDYLSQSGMRAETLELTADMIMTAGVISCRLDDSMLGAMNIMREKGYSQLPVVTREGKNVGTITDSVLNDLLIGGTTLESLKRLMVSKAMIPPLPVLHRSSPVSMIYPMLRYFSAVLISDGGEIKGIVTKADVLKAVEIHG
ncbi:MAG: CBS domain-containing protein [Candidatus Thermoplasmatota archaeon]|nr:CBS domain-containing protein [Candidatus Thermoplasmatota archaeon]